MPKNKTTINNLEKLGYHVVSVVSSEEVSSPVPSAADIDKYAAQSVFMLVNGCWAFCLDRKPNTEVRKGKRYGA